MKTTLLRLLADLEIAHEKSDIKKYCLKYGHEWHYSLVTTTLESGGPLILGFNWGASQDEKYLPQTSINSSKLTSQDTGSFSRIIPYCEKYFGSDFLAKASQSNYCFFRSKSESQISDRDIQLCEPVFEKLIDVIEPSSILCFSSKLRDYLTSKNRIHSSTSKTIPFKRGSSNVEYEAIKAKLSSGQEIKFLPHPNYPMKGHARSDAWEFCCGNN